MTENDIDVNHQNKTIERQRKQQLKKRYLRISGLLLIIIGLAVLAYPLSTFVVTDQAQLDLRAEWEKKIKEAEESSEKSPTAHPTGAQKTPSNQKSIPAGKAAFRLMIPKIDFDMIVVEGTDTDLLKLGPGHISKTVMPGGPGVCVVSGHRTTYGAPFFQLDRVGVGDEIIIEIMDTPPNPTRLTYKVFETKTVSPSNTSFIRKATSESILTLTTCTPIHSARERLVVFARIS